MFKPNTARRLQYTTAAAALLCTFATGASAQNIDFPAAGVFQGAYSAKLVKEADTAIIGLSKTAAETQKDATTKSDALLKLVTDAKAADAVLAYDNAVAAQIKTQAAADDAERMLQDAALAAGALPSYSYADYVAGRLNPVDKAAIDLIIGTPTNGETQSEATVRAQNAQIRLLLAPTTASVKQLYTDYTQATGPARIAAQKAYSDAASVLARIKADNDKAQADLSTANDSSDQAVANNIKAGKAFDKADTALTLLLSPGAYLTAKEAASTATDTNKTAQDKLAYATLLPTGAGALTGIAATENTATNAKAAARALLGTSTATDSTFEVEIVRGLNNEETQRVAADVALGGLITTETTDRKAADVALGGLITTETTDRKAADVALGGLITAETTRATAAEGAEITARAAAITAEQNARSSADTNLGTRITGENTRATAAEAGLGTRITILTEQVKKDIATATAVAVALGGNSFLPGKKFNLTVNVGSYDGESALAAQFGFMVNDSLAINGGVASGFGSGSSTAVRGGFTYGW